MLDWCYFRPEVDRFGWVPETFSFGWSLGDVVRVLGNQPRTDEIKYRVTFLHLLGAWLPWQDVQRQRKKPPLAIGDPGTRIEKRRLFTFTVWRLIFVLAFPIQINVLSSSFVFSQESIIRQCFMHLTQVIGGAEHLWVLAGYIQKLHFLGLC